MVSALPSRVQRAQVRNEGEVRPGFGQDGSSRGAWKEAPETASLALSDFMSKGRETVKAQPGLEPLVSGHLSGKSAWIGVRLCRTG